MFGIKVFFLNLSKHIWPKVTLFALFAAFSALAAIFMGEYIPDDIAYKIDGETIGSILTILASSMLAVTTFSLTLMVQAYSSATTTVTPRATQLVIQDHTAQNVLSTFLGTFLFSLIGIIALNTGVYRANGRLILFATTLVIVVVILVSMIRWIERLTKIGRVAETTRQVEEAARESLGKRAASPWFGCNKLDEEKLSGLEGIFGDIYGYVQYVDFEKISEVADRNECEIHVAATPGKFVYPNQAYLHANVRLSEEDVQALLSAFKIADERTFEQDPRFGICVLAEIAERALSPAVNDPGTAIDVLGRLVSVLAVYAGAKNEEVKCKRVWAPPMRVYDLFEDAFNSISRDGAGYFEVQARLQKCFACLAMLDDREYAENAAAFSSFAVVRSERSDMLEHEKAEVRQLADCWKH